MPSEVAVLFTRRNSEYLAIPGCDCYDKARDARTYPGGLPVIAHPPCRSWGNYRGVAKPEPGEHELAPWAIGQVRRWGGVVEHPAGSLLWDEIGLPGGPARDAFGGWTLSILQGWWGHRALKPTVLYVCGIDRAKVLPLLPPPIATPSRTVEGMSQAERKCTPPRFAEWLVHVARLCARAPGEHRRDVGVHPGAGDVHTSSRGAHKPGPRAPLREACAHLYWETGDPINGEELWHPVAGYEGLYEVSTLGRVMRIAAGRGTRPGTRAGRALKASQNKDGYLTVRLSNGRARTRNVHELVARTFLGAAPSDEFGLMEAHHVNHDRGDCRVSNLEWKSNKENASEQWNDRRTGRA